MAAIIVGDDGTSKLTIDPTSKAARLELYDAAGNAIVPAPTIRSYVANVLIRQSATTAANNAVWALFNPSLTTLVRIRAIGWAHIFDGTNAAAGTTYAWNRIGGLTTPSGGTAIVPTKKRSGDAASACTVRFLDTGLTLGTTIRTPTDGFFRSNLSINQTNSRYEVYSVLERAAFRNNGPIECGPREGIGLFLVTAAAVVGQGACGYVEWDEVTI